MKVRSKSAHGCRRLSAQSLRGFVVPANLRTTYRFLSLYDIYIYIYIYIYTYYDNNNNNNNDNNFMYICIYIYIYIYIYTTCWLSSA